MASFDITQAANAGYKTVWAERSYLAKLAVVPFLIKLVCFSVVLLLGWEQQFLRQAIIMLPAYFADGWLCAHIVRLIFLDQRWPFRPTGNTDKDMQTLQDRALGIMRGTLFFVVIKFLLAGITEILYYASESGLKAEEGEVNILVFLTAIGGFVFLFWAFRLLWLYIPAAINYPVRAFLIGLGGFAASWRLIGLWFLCFIPAFFGFGILLSVLGSLVSNPAESVELAFVINVMRVLLDTIVSILATAGIAYGIKNYVLPQR